MSTTTKNQNLCTGRLSSRRGAPPPTPVTTVKRFGCVLYLLPRRELACLREC